MPRIYIAGPLFSEAELRYNLELDEFLLNLGFETFLPQRDGYKLSDLLAEGMTKSEALRVIFDKDVEEIKNCDIVILIMDGRVPDEGACVEIGYAYALMKECVGIKTDSRSLLSGLDNPLIIGALHNRIASNYQELEGYLLGIANKSTNISECCETMSEEIINNKPQA